MDMKEVFTKKWSCWWILHSEPKRQKLDEAFEKELNALISNEASSFEFIPVSKRLPDENPTKQLLVKIKVWDGYRYEIGRYTEWGFMYGTRNTQDMLQGVVFWAELPENKI